MTRKTDPPRSSPLSHQAPAEVPSDSSPVNSPDDDVANPVLHFAFRYRIALAMVFVVLFFSWLGFHFGDRYGLLVGFFTAAIFIALVFFYVDRRIVKLFAAKALEGRDPWGVLRTVNEEARRWSMKSPETFLLDSSTPTAFSAGLFARTAKLFISKGLVEKLRPDEVALVISYELMRLRDEQTQTLTALTSVASLVATVANAFDAVLFLPLKWYRPFWGQRELRIYGPMTLLTSPLVAFLVRFGVRRREIIAIDEKLSRRGDHAGEKWALTLSKLDAYSKTLPLDVNLAEASLFTVNPLSRYSWCRFASAQPSIESRVRALTDRFPL